MKVLLGELRQESNSFNPTPTGMDLFKMLHILEGEELLHPQPAERASICGMLEVLREYGAQIVPTIGLIAGSGGPIEHAILEGFITRLEDAILREGPFDGIFLALHGGMMSTREDDACGYLLGRVRELAGERTVISASFDLHANVTPACVKNADIVCGYHTYPHVDLLETGRRAALLGIDKISGKKRFMASAHVPMMAPAGGYTTTEGKLKALMQRAEGLAGKDGIADYSIFQVQPWLDVPEICSTVIVIGEDEAVCRTAAASLANEELAIRDSLVRIPESLNSCIRLALEKKDSDPPLILINGADSPNAGAACNSPEVLSHLLPYAQSLRAAVCIEDADAVKRAFELGVGAQSEFTLGGCETMGLDPLTLTARVKSLHEGDFYMEGASVRLSRCDIGPTAVLAVGLIRILVCTDAKGSGDPQFYRAFGIDPAMCAIVEVKACTSPRLLYAPVSADMHAASTRGAADQELQRLPFKRLPHPFYPFDEISKEDISYFLRS